MIMKVNKKLFIREFQDISPNNFSRGALIALFDHLEKEDEDEHPREHYCLDVIRLCSEYLEYKNIKAFEEEHGHIISWDAVLNLTEVIKIPGTKGFLIEYMLNK